MPGTKKPHAGGKEDASELGGHDGSNTGSSSQESSIHDRSRADE